MIYKGINIYKADRNASGIKYFCYTDDGILRADTLAGIKQAITNYKNGGSIWGL